MEARSRAVPVLVLAAMLAGTLLIPSVRPLFAAWHHGSESAMHAFFSLNMLGACIGAPLLSAVADRNGSRRRMAVGLALADGLLLLGCAFPFTPVAVVLVLRFLQGAAGVAALSILMGYASHSSLGAAPARSRGGEGGRMGLTGTAVVAAIALGPPLGSLLLRISVAAPVRVASALALSVAAAAYVLLPVGDEVRVERRRGALDRRLLLPTLWIAAERFAVGCFVVTFGLHAHHVLGIRDGSVGLLMSLFLVPFAVACWPMARLAERAGGTHVIVAGGAIYGLGFVLLGNAGMAAMPLLLVALGTASAAIYAPALGLGASLAGPDRRATSMGAINAGGALGMLAGTATAGIVSALLSARGMPRAEIYPWIFRVAGAVPLLLAALSLRPLASLASRAAFARIASLKALVKETFNVSLKGAA